MLPLIGVGLVVVGFALRLNPLVVVLAAAFGAGLGAGMSPLAVLAALGHAFNANRFVSLAWLVLPVIGLLEREGLQEQARSLVAGARRATTGRILILYFVYRQVTAALGLIALGGQAQMVRPLVAPMAEGAAEARLGVLPLRAVRLIRAHAAAAENLAVLFAEDVFVAMASILLIRGVLMQEGVVVEPLRLSLWALPTAAAALGIHGVRLWRLDGRLRRAAEAGEPAGGKPAGAP